VRHTAAKRHRHTAARAQRHTAASAAHARLVGNDTWQTGRAQSLRRTWPPVLDMAPVMALFDDQRGRACFCVLGCQRRLKIDQVSTVEC
jgi:hypothetical protein